MLDVGVTFVYPDRLRVQMSRRGDDCRSDRVDERAQRSASGRGEALTPGSLITPPEAGRQARWRGPVTPATPPRRPVPNRFLIVLDTSSQHLK